MKHFFNIALLLVLLLSLNSCFKDDTPTSLPPATQTGKGTFGCLVNGKPFVHNDGIINCYYQYVDGGYHFAVGGSNFDYNDLVGIFIGTEGKEISEGQTYPLVSWELGNAHGAGSFKISATNIEGSITSPDYTGELTITKLDFENYIVSGEFWFNLKHPITGDTVKIRQGRFDSHFGS